MGIGSSKKDIIKNVKILEIFEDGDYDEYIKLKEKMDKDLKYMKDVLTMTNYEKRNALHMVCFKGYFNLAKDLIPLYNRLNLDLDKLDSKGDTALNLVCSHGFDEESEIDITEMGDNVTDYIDYTSKFLHEKNKIVNLLLHAGSNIRDSVQKGKNNPMHWCIYYGDLLTGMDIFKEFPLIILQTNGDGYTPMEILFHKSLQKVSKLQAKLLVKRILTIFVKSLFDEKSIKENIKNRKKSEKNGEFDQNDTKEFVFKENSLQDFNILHNSLPEDGFIFKSLKRNSKKKNLLLFSGKNLLNKVLLDSHKFKNQFKHQIEKIFVKDLKKEPSGFNEDAKKNDNVFQKLLKKKESFDEDKKENFGTDSYDEDIKDKKKRSRSDDSDDSVDEKNKKSKKKKNKKSKKNKDNISNSGENNSISLESDHYPSDDYENEKKIDIFIFDEKNESNFTPSLIFMHKLLMIAIYSKDMKIIKLLIDAFMVSPFIPSINGLSAFHFACYKGYLSIVKFFLNANFKYYKAEKKRKFNIEHHINKRRGPEFNTCLHLAALNTKLQTFNLLIEKGGDINIFNYQDYRPLDLNKKDAFNEKRHFENYENEQLNDKNIIPDLRNLDSYNQLAMESINENYIYIIATKDSEEDPSKTLIRKQLSLIQETWGDIEVRELKPFVEKSGTYFRHYFLLKFSEEVIDKIADFLDFHIFNKENGYVTRFLIEKSKEFDKFRDYHLHQIIYYLLNNEFHLNHYFKTGIIEAAFPLHDFRTRRNIKLNWDKEKKEVFFDPLKLKTNKKDLRPFNSLAFYYGCDVALYISFITMSTSYMIILTFIGIVFYIITLIVWGTELDNRTTPFYSLLISIFITIIYEKWKQRENEHVKIWNTENFKNNEIPRLEYLGDYVIDPITKKIEEKNKFTTFQRRLITEIPLMALGAGFIIGLFYLFTFLNQIIRDLTKEETDNLSTKVSEATMKSILGVSAGIGNGILIFILTEIYRAASNIIVAWENHKYESDKENSFIVKTFVFNFFISYLNLFYYALILQDFTSLAVNFISIIISKNLLFFLKMNLLPYLIFYYKKKTFLKKWISKRMDLKEEKIKNENLEQIIKNSETFDALSDEVKNKLYKIEKNLILQEQVELSMLMPNPPDQIELWKNNVIQFGYVAFFSVAFPPATLWGLIVNVSHIFFIYFSFSDHIKRTPSKERDSIGVWNYILSFMVFFSLVINVSILVFTSNSINKIVNEEEKFTKNDIFLTLVILEHLVFILIFIMQKLINDEPKWVRDENKKAKFLKDILELKIKKKYHKVKKKKKLANRISHFATIGNTNIGNNFMLGNSNISENKTLIDQENIKLKSPRVSDIRNHMNLNKPSKPDL